MSKQIVLCDLERIEIERHRKMTTWLEAVPRLKEGVEITLGDYEPDAVWKVVKIYESPFPHTTSDFDFHRKWDNNNYDKHKGLNV